MADDGPEEDDIWDDDPDDGYELEPDEPCWMCWDSHSGSCWSHGGAPPLKVRRRLARRWALLRRGWRKNARHDNDRFWQARNRPAFDDSAPF